MTDLSTTYMGMKLANPLIVGSSTHTISAEKIKELEQAGAGAVVLKSIFEEQIRVEVADVYESLRNSLHPEAYEYLDADMPMQLGPMKYLNRIQEIKEAVKIPVIASINCTASDEWISFARKVEASGADAVELNVYDIPDDFETTASEIEERHLQLVEDVKNQLKIPVAIKLSPYYTSIPDVVRRLVEKKVDAVVLFNRFFQPDINVDDVKIVPSVNLSKPDDIRLPLRWIAILRDHIDCDICLTSGVHDAEGGIKAILAGANAFQICSVLYKQDASCIGEILKGLGNWMQRHGYKTLDEARGLLSQHKISKGAGFERVQYMKTLTGME